MEQFPSWLFWMLVAAMPLGIAAASYWAMGFSRPREPKVRPGEPGNPD